MAEIPQPEGIDLTQAIRVDYTNYRGERRIRTVVPIKIHCSMNQFHGLFPQWLMDVYDVEKGAFRTYAFLNIHGFKLL